MVEFRKLLHSCSLRRQHPCTFHKTDMSNMNSRRILVIAGSDSSGGAGLEADQKVIAAHGCYAMTATTALTAQNTQGVNDVHITPSSFVAKQIDACLDDIGVDVVKVGMLACTETVSVVAEAFRRHAIQLAVVDPVMVATSGAQLLPEAAVTIMRESLLPLTTILTPNIPEAKALLEGAGEQPKLIRNVDDLIAVAKAVHKLGPRYVLIKGGHLPLTQQRIAAEKDEDKHIVVDVLYGDDLLEIFETPYVTSRNTHGTGCSLASAIASNLALGMKISQAVFIAVRYVEAGIRTAFDLGKGSGPINHFHSSYMLPFTPGHFMEYLLRHNNVQAPWKEHVEHQFVAKLADGSLPLESFQYYLIQDYLFLIQFSRANALAAYKAKSLSDITASADIVSHLARETQLHIEYCQEFGLSEEEIVRHDEHQACTAYTRYVLDIGQAEDYFALQLAMAPCTIGYAVIARRLFDDPRTLREGNRYWKWIETYAGSDYDEAVRVSSALLEREASKQSPSRIERLVEIFIHATKMETGFWDMGLNYQKS